MRLIEPLIDQKQWGSSKSYPDYHRWSNYRPDMYVLHWGGIGPYRATTRALLFRLARGWQRFHIESRGWWDIAYNVMPAKGGSLIRLRGLNHNGAHADSARWGGITFTVVFPLGVNEPNPKPWMLRAFALQWAEYPAPVTGHGLLPGQNTSCPGPALRAWIMSEGWLDVLGDIRFGTRNRRVRALRRRLHDLGYLDKRTGSTYGTGVRRAVTAFKADHDLGTDPNRVGRAMWKKLADQGTPS